MLLIVSFDDFFVAVGRLGMFDILHTLLRCYLQAKIHSNMSIAEQSNVLNIFLLMCILSMQSLPNVSFLSKRLPRLTTLFA